MPLKNKEARKAYHREYMAKRYLLDPAYKEKHLARVGESRRRQKTALSEAVAGFKSNGCLICGELDQCCLVAHHVDPGAKAFNIADGIRSLVAASRMLDELKKCVCLCSNCHYKVHSGRASVP